MWTTNKVHKIPRTNAQFNQQLNMFFFFLGNQRNRNNKKNEL